MVMKQTKFATKTKRYDKSEIRTHAPFETTELMFKVL